MTNTTLTQLPERALSLTGPWWWLMLYLPEPWRKCVENRSPRFSGRNFRGPTWVHAAKGVTRAKYDAALQFARDAGVPLKVLYNCPSFDAMPRGGIVGRFTIVAGIPDPLVTADESFACSESDLARIQRWRMPEHIGLLTEQARTVPFTPCAGALGFWRVPAGVLAQLAVVAS